MHNWKRYIYSIQPSTRSDRDRDIIEMIMGLSNTYTNQQLNTSQQPGGGNRNYVLGSRRRMWSYTPQDGRRTSRYLFIFHQIDAHPTDVVYNDSQRSLDNR